jgi:hypothetical protein
MCSGGDTLAANLKPPLGQRIIKMVNKRGMRMTDRKLIGNVLLWNLSVVGVVLLLTMMYATPATAQRILGADISYWNRGSSSPSSDGITQNANVAYANGRVFVLIRATRGGTTGVNQAAGNPSGGSSATLSQRYDDPDFVRNIVRATNAGMIAGPYHFGRPDVAGNTGTDEANH